MAVGSQQLECREQLIDRAILRVDLRGDLRQLPGRAA